MSAEDANSNGNNNNETNNPDSESFVKQFLEKLMHLAPFSRSSVVDNDGRCTIPRESRAHMQVLPKNEIKFYNLPGRFVLIRKSVAITFLALVASGLIIAGEAYTRAYAQEFRPPPTEQHPLYYGTVDTNPYTVLPTPFEHFLGPTAYIPLRISLTLPSGGTVIGNASALAGGAYNINWGVDTPTKGVATVTFYTTASDRFDIFLGQKYTSLDTSIPHYAFLTVYANDTKSYEHQYLIDKPNFALHFIAETAQPPHYPTLAELKSVNADDFQTITNLARQGVTIAQDTHNNFSDAASGVRLATISIIFVGFVGGIEAVMIFLLYHRLSALSFTEVNKKEDKDSPGKPSVNKNGSPPPSHQGSSSLFRLKGNKRKGERDRDREENAKGEQETSPPSRSPIFPQAIATRTSTTEGLVATPGIETELITSRLPTEDPDKAFEEMKRSIRNDTQGGVQDGSEDAGEKHVEEAVKQQ